MYPKGRRKNCAENELNGGRGDKLEHNLQFFGAEGVEKWENECFWEQKALQKHFRTFFESFKKWPINAIKTKKSGR